MVGELIERVTMADLIKQEIRHFPTVDKKAIFDFIQYVKTHKTLDGLEGRNKESYNVNTDDPNYFNKVQYAIDNHLWHYHIGILSYDKTKIYGDRTSEYVLHYQHLKNEIRIVDYSAPPPSLYLVKNISTLRNGLY